jgi:shikimate kinase
MDMDQEIDRRLGYSFHQLVAQMKAGCPFGNWNTPSAGMQPGAAGCCWPWAGGTVRYQWNLDVLKGTGPIVFLNAPLEVLKARVQKAQRPRVTVHQDLGRELEAIWQNSGQKYLDAADLVIDTHPKTLDVAAQDLIRALSEFF